MLYFVTEAYNNFAGFVLANMVTIFVSLAAIVLSFVTLNHLSVARTDKEWMQSMEGIKAEQANTFLRYEHARGNIKGSERFEV